MSRVQSDCPSCCRWNPCSQRTGRGEGSGGLSSQPEDEPLHLLVLSPSSNKPGCLSPTFHMPQTQQTHRTRLQRGPWGTEKSEAGSPQKGSRVGEQAMRPGGPCTLASSQRWPLRTRSQAPQPGLSSWAPGHSSHPGGPQMSGCPLSRPQVTLDASPEQCHC